MKAKDMPTQPGDYAPVNEKTPHITWGHLFGRKAMKEKTKKIVREGFWRSKEEPDLPKPVPLKKPWKGGREFLTALARLEYRLKPAFFKGTITCRVCGCRNGSGEYTHGGFRWPTGFYHYVKMHNVKPSEAFIQFVLGNSEK